MKLRPESSILLAAALALGAAVACEPASPNNDGTPPAGSTAGTGGMPGTTTTGGMPGTTTTGGMPGTTTQGGMPGTTTQGGMPGTTTQGGMPGTTTTGGMPGTSTTGGAAGGGDAGVVDGGAAGGATGGGAWMPVVPSKVKGTGTTAMCLSTQTPANGKCGSYYCGVDKATLSPEINPTAPCGKDADGMTGQAVWDYVCEASLPATVTECAGMHTDKAVTDLLTGGKTFETATLDCVKANAVVKEKKVPQACLDCFAKVAFCCAADTLGCASTCSGGASKACDDAQKAKGCVSPLFACAGLPDPL